MVSNGQMKEEVLETLKRKYPKEYTKAIEQLKKWKVNEKTQVFP